MLLLLCDDDSGGGDGGGAAAAAVRLLLLTTATALRRRRRPTNPNIDMMAARPVGFVLLARRWAATAATDAGACLAHRTRRTRARERRAALGVGG